MTPFNVELFTFRLCGGGAEEDNCEILLGIR